MKKILITGGTGRLGRYMPLAFPDALYPARKELDLTNRPQVFDYIKSTKPDIVIHLAALVPIRECEQNKPLAWETNVNGTASLIDACEAHAPGAYFIYISSPCVFSGFEGDYTEESIPHPKNFYGLTKVVAETIVSRSRLAQKLVLRTNFVTKEKWPYPGAFTDRFGTYLFADDVAYAIKEVTSRGATGLLHVVGERKMSMFELARMTTPDVKPMSSKDYSGPPLTMDTSMRTIHPEWRKFKISEPSAV